MTATEAWTWLSIGILVLGAPLVFLWFLRDAIRLLAGLGREREEGEDDVGADGGDGRSGEGRSGQGGDGQGGDAPRGPGSARPPAR